MAKFKVDQNGQVYLPEITDEEIILYSTGCPKCKVIESKLQANGIYYTKNTSVDEMTKLGFTTVPVLKVGEKCLTFGEAVKWVNSRKDDCIES